MKYYIGIRAENALGNREGTVEITLPGDTYAMFTTPKDRHEDFVNTIHRTWAYINTEHFKTCGYLRGRGYEFECYTEDSRTYSERIYIPIRRL